MGVNNFKSIFLIVFLTIGCYIDTEVSNDIIIKDKPNIVVENVNVVCNVIDENGLAMEGLTAKYGGTIKNVKNSNYFHFEGQKVNKNFEVLEIIDKDGEKHNFFLPIIENEVCYFSPMLLKKASFLEKQSNEDVEVKFTNNLKLSIARNSYFKSNSTYQGQVKLYYKYYNLSNPLTRQALPGGLITQNKNNETIMLLITEAFKIEARTNDNRILEFGIGCNINTSDTTNDLYYYNSEVNNWKYVSSLKEENIIEKSGIYCVAQSTKFHSIKGKLNSKGSPNPNVKVNFTYNKILHSTYTTNNGTWESIVPDDTKVLLDYEVPCEFQLKVLAPTNKDTNYPTDQIDDNLLLSHFSGTVKDCDGNILHNSFLKIRTDFDTKIIYTNTGKIDLFYPHCNSSKIYISSINETYSQSGAEIEWKCGVENNIYSSFACNDKKANYAILKIDDGSKTYFDGASSKLQDRVILQFLDKTYDATFNLSIKANSVGIVDVKDINIEWTDKTFGGIGYSLYCPTSQNCGFEKFEITHFASEKGGLIRGYFKGKFWLKTFNPLMASNKDIEGEFQITRDF